MGAKNILTSKTFWANLLTGTVTVLATAQQWMPAEYAVYVVAAQSIANILLRLVTHQPVTLTGPSPTTTRTIAFLALLAVWMAIPVTAEARRCAREDYQACTEIASQAGQAGDETCREGQHRAYGQCEQAGHDQFILCRDLPTFPASWAECHTDTEGFVRDCRGNAYADYLACSKDVDRARNAARRACLSPPTCE